MILPSEEMEIKQEMRERERGREREREREREGGRERERKKQVFIYKVNLYENVSRNICKYF